MSREAWRDIKQGESINLYHPAQLESFLMTEFGYVATPQFLQYSQGEVLSDPYGDGTFQRFITDIDD